MVAYFDFNGLLGHSQMQLRRQRCSATGVSQAVVQQIAQQQAHAGPIERQQGHVLGRKQGNGRGARMAPAQFGHYLARQCGQVHQLAVQGGVPAGQPLAPWPDVRCVYVQAAANADLLRGAELWNRGRYWEAHEAWEEPWRAAGRHTPAGRFFQGLILLAAAALKHERGAAATARRLAARAARVLATAEAGPPPFAAPAFAAAVAAWLAGERPEAPRFDTFGAPQPHGWA